VMSIEPAPDSPPKHNRHRNILPDGYEVIEVY
jgi:hypothetical protein